MAVVGVLALQGSFNEHMAGTRLGVKGVEIRKPEQLHTISSLIIPGGESTTMAKLAEYHNLDRRLVDKIWSGDLIVQCIEISLEASFEAELSVPQLASLEGGPETFRGVFIRAPAILEAGPEVQVLADYPVSSDKLLSFDTSTGDKKSPLAKTAHNSVPYRILDFQTSWLHFPILNELLIYLIIRFSTIVTCIADPSVPFSIENAEEESKVIVAVRQGNILGTAFHPELTADTRWHSYFLKMSNETGEEASLSNLVPAQVTTSHYQLTRSDLPIFQ
ncbi:hypothetical protein V8G54_009376 [Vigna mungo]|uniref:glutaminase n=1 Tax=Vigna mungo TaxID=3915 RepID=A0AAQ3NUP6_VIGMU